MSTAKIDPLEIERRPAERSVLVHYLQLPDSAIDAWQRDPAVCWIPEECLLTMSGCFDLCGEHLDAGETRELGDRVAYLLQGSLQLPSVNERLPAGALLDHRLMRSGGLPVGTVLRAEEPCDLVWWHADAARTACYCGCWFHARLLREFEQKSKQR